MREVARDRERLIHIKEAISRINRYIAEIDLEHLLDDDMRYYAVVKNIEIIGEAANMLTDEFKSTHQTTPWKMIIGMRNYIIHEYFQVKFGVVKEVLTLDLPELEKQIDAYLME